MICIALLLRAATVCQMCHQPKTSWYVLAGATDVMCITGSADLRADLCVPALSPAGCV
jgi:hypothetical protein